MSVIRYLLITALKQVFVKSANRGKLSKNNRDTSAPKSRCSAGSEVFSDKKPAKVSQFELAFQNNAYNSVQTRIYPQASSFQYSWHVASNYKDG